MHTWLTYSTVCVVAATVEVASLQQKSLSQLSPTARLTEASFPPRSDWVANYRPTYVSACWSYSRPAYLLNYPLSILAAWGQVLSVTPTLLLWLRMATKESGQATSAEPRDVQTTDRWSRVLGLPRERGNRVSYSVLPHANALLKSQCGGCG